MDILTQKEVKNILLYNPETGDFFNKKPNPIELKKIISIDKNITHVNNWIEKHRNVFCPYYGECLDIAIKSKWKTFSCSKCDFKDIKWANSLNIDWFGEYE